MEATSITISRTFFLGGVGQQHFPEAVTFSVCWNVRGIPMEQVEEQAIAEIYQMAERERKRRYKYMKAYAEEKKAAEKAERAAATT